MQEACQTEKGQEKIHNHMVLLIKIFFYGRLDLPCRTHEMLKI